MKWKKLKIASLTIGTVAAITAPFIFDLYVFRAISGYSGQRLILHFSSLPTETDLLDAMIRSDPNLDDPEELIHQWRKTVSEGSTLKIKIDAQKCLAIKPFDPANSPDTVFANGTRITGVWLTEPSTRRQIPVPLIVLSYISASFVCVALTSFLLLRFLVFTFRLIRAPFDGVYKLRNNSATKTPLTSLAIGIKTNSHILKIIGGIFFVLSLVTGVFWICGANVEPVAFVLGLIASTFFSVPSIARFLVPDRKAVREMSAEEILNFIMTTDAENDWKRVSTDWVTEHYLLEDPRLRFRCRFDEAGVHCKNFNEAWATKHPDPHATSYWHDLYYDSGLIDRFILVSVDGARADIPMPSILSPLHEITKFQYHVAKIYDYCGLLDEYLERCGIKVSQPVE